MTDLVTILRDGELVEVPASSVIVDTTEPSASVPQSVSRAQAKISLARAGLLEQANALIAQAGVEAQIWWQDASTFDRNHPLIEQIGGALEQDEEAIDELFRVAASVSA